MGNVTSIAVSELREVARFMDAHAEQIVGDFDGVWVAEGGVHVEFDLLEHDSVNTLRVTKDYLVMERCR